MSFAIRSGTVHALVGENGAGKSTLVKTWTGIVQPDEGEIAIEGTFGGSPTPRGGARWLGIVAMYQEPTVFEDLSVAENVFARASPHPLGTRRLGGDARRGRLRILGDPRRSGSTPIRQCAGSASQTGSCFEIAKALSLQARGLLIMDEPTAALSPNEVDSLFAHRPSAPRSVASAILYIKPPARGDRGELADTRHPPPRRLVTSSAPRPRELSQAEIIKAHGRTLARLSSSRREEGGSRKTSSSGPKASLSWRPPSLDVSFELQARARSSASPASSARGGPRSLASIFGCRPRFDEGRGLWIEDRSSGRGRRAPRLAARAGNICPKTCTTQGGSSSRMSILAERVPRLCSPELTLRWVRGRGASRL